MKKIISLVLVCIALAIGKNPIIVALAVASTDLTNVSKSNYTIYTDIPLDDSLEGQDLCEIDEFRDIVDDYTCSKPISYELVDFETADIVISREGIDTDKMVVCLSKSENCDIAITKKTRLNKESLKAKGFIPEPTKSW